METAFLQSFVLVAETGSMAEAARRQDLTPAAVAQQVRALERELRATLVARSGRTVRLPGRTVPVRPRSVVGPKVPSPDGDPGHS